MKNVIASVAKRSIISCFVASLLATTLCVAAQSPLFDQASAKYKEGDFKGALETYQALVESGQDTFAVYYNMGNASLKMGQKGHALLYYLRAKKVDPRDSDLLWNIEVLKDTLKDRIEERSHFAIAYLRSLVDRLTVQDVAYCFSALLAIFAVLCLGASFFPQWPLGAIKVPVLVALFLAGLLFGFKIWDTKDARVVVLDKESTAYYGPSDRETKAFVLHEGAQGRLLDRSGEWIYISLDNKNAGWIRKNTCEIV
jgi:tetratricopeptide (TPR) repeat protein